MVDSAEKDFAENDGKDSVENDYKDSAENDSTESTGIVRDKSWYIEVLDTPRDGSCFFSSIAMAINDSIWMWYDIDDLRIRMETYWEMYREETDESLCEVTSDLVRFMCSLNVDDAMLETYNAEADYRIETEKVRANKFDTPADLGKHMRKKSTWGDHAAFHAFLRSLDYKCGVVVFDAEIGGMSYLPPEWTRNKKAYICLRRENNHYGVLRLFKLDTGEKCLCLNRETMLEVVKSVNNMWDSSKTLGLESF